MFAINQAQNGMIAELINRALYGLAADGNANGQSGASLPSLLSGMAPTDTVKFTNVLGLPSTGQATSAAPQTVADQTAAQAQQPAATQGTATDVNSLLDMALKLNSSGGGMLSTILSGTALSAAGTDAKKADADTAAAKTDGAANGLSAEAKAAKEKKIEELKKQIVGSSNGKRAKKRQENWGNEIHSLEKALGLPPSNTSKDAINASLNKKKDDGAGTATSAAKTDKTDKKVTNPATKQAINQAMQGVGGATGRNLTAFTGQNFLPSFNASTILRNTIGGTQAAGQAVDGTAQGTNAFNLGGMGGINLGTTTQQQQQTFNAQQWGTGIDPTLMRALEVGNAQPSASMQRALALAGFNPNTLNATMQQVLNTPIALPAQKEKAATAQAAAKK